MTALAIGASLALAGCGKFFVYPGSTTTSTTGSGSSASTDYAYVANSSSGSTYLNGFALSSGTLTATTSSPYDLDYTPTAIAVTPSGSFVYVAVDAAVNTAGVYGYSVGSGGALSILNGGASFSSYAEESLAVSPDGNYLFALDASTITLDEYTIDTSTGGLSLTNSLSLAGASGGTITLQTLEVSPTGDYVACALGTGGAEIFSLDESTGVLGTANLISPSSSAIGIFALASDGSDYLYAAGTAGLQVFSVTTAGVPTQTNTTYAVGTAPRSVVLSTNYDYVYVANQGSSTISGFSNSSGTLTALTGSPFTAPSSVGALGVDNSGNYLLAEGYGASGIELYTIASGGALTESSAAASGVATTNPVIPVAVGVTP